MQDHMHITIYCFRDELLHYIVAYDIITYFPAAKSNLT